MMLIQRITQLAQVQAVAVVAKAAKLVGGFGGDGGGSSFCVFVYDNGINGRVQDNFYNLAQVASVELAALVVWEESVESVDKEGS